ncbi:hypothetical protein K469DRAFT_695297 [Zopfia rhizophila CBS 207.26]|uniref:Uncharacterized protein n=1 Tax=Zopfia rhizophila CBS 207.26 TaxID=1314779 RepID=A0A6A6DJP4_9PEZI|nr:hypothetical protein K469DRAFT_695297 [Zopfia rhizophila CBS 207.26]
MNGKRFHYLYGTALAAWSKVEAAKKRIPQASPGDEVLSSDTNPSKVNQMARLSTQPAPLKDAKEIAADNMEITENCEQEEEDNPTRDPIEEAAGWATDRHAI